MNDTSVSKYYCLWIIQLLYTPENYRNRELFVTLTPLHNLYRLRNGLSGERHLLFGELIIWYRIEPSLQVIDIKV